MTRRRKHRAARIVHRGFVTTAGVHADSGGLRRINAVEEAPVILPRRRPPHRGQDRVDDASARSRSGAAVRRWRGPAGPCRRVAFVQTSAKWERAESRRRPTGIMPNRRALRSPGDQSRAARRLPRGRHRPLCGGEAAVWSRVTVATAATIVAGVVPVVTPSVKISRTKEHRAGSTTTFSRTQLRERRGGRPGPPMKPPCRSESGRRRIRACP